MRYGTLDCKCSLPVLSQGVFAQKRFRNHNYARQERAGGPLDTAKVLKERKKNLGTNISTHMVGESPLHMVRGKGCFLYNSADEEYLDCINNVAHLGHAHPKVWSMLSYPT